MTTAFVARHFLPFSSDPSFPHQLPHNWSSCNLVGSATDQSTNFCLSNTPRVKTRWSAVSVVTLKTCEGLDLNLFHQLEQEEIVSLGGPGKSVEIGVISLGTTSADGSKREVRKISSNSSVFTDGSHSKLMFICLIFFTLVAWSNG